MQRSDTEVAGSGSMKILAALAGAGFALAALLALIVFVPATWREFRWIAPIAAASLNVGIVALGARPGRTQESRPSKAMAQPGARRVRNLAFWRTAVLRACGRLRTIRGWPWLVILCGALALLLCMTTVLAFDRRPVAESAGERKIMALACGAALALAFVTLLVERVWAAETEHSRSGGTLTAMLRVLLLVTLAGATGAALNAWQGIDARTLALISALLPGAIALELMVRAVSTWFTPPERHAAPPERVHGTIARMLTSPLASSGEVGEGLRRRYGIDMRQSWVIRSTLRLLPVACAGLAFVAWLLSGVSVLQPDQRAVYERFGAPAAVWQPGLHVGMPWPFGRARMLENGAVHQLVVSSAGGDGGVAPLVAADARTPAQMDRLWDVAHPWETTQVIAGGSGQRQNFEIVNADVRLDYRIRQDDAAARASQYRFSETPALIRAIAGSEVVGYLASHRLDALVETRQTIIADAIRRAVQQQFDVLGGGIEIVAVVIESVHPPAGASAAWHNVQAAQIRAAASVAQARGLAATVVGSAAETAAASLDAASAGAAETVSAARTRQTTFAADIAARQAGGRAFPLEYYLHALQRGLQNANLTVIDDRLVGGNRATIDLRAYNTGDAAGAKRLY